MKEEFIPYEEALALKELGFDEPCSAFYKLGDSQIYYDTILQSQNVHFRTNSELNFYQDLKEKISAPLYQQAFRWFREKYNLVSPITPNGLGQYDFRIEMEWCGRIYDTYEEAELACLRKLIEICQK